MSSTFNYIFQNAEPWLFSFVLSATLNDEGALIESEATGLSAAVAIE